MCIFLCAAIGSAQPVKQNVPNERENSVALFGGMGIHALSSPDVVDYINTVALYSQRVNDYSSGIEFYGGIELPIAASWGLKAEHRMLFSSVSVPLRTGGTADFYYAMQSPSVMVQSVLAGKGYFLKLGAGGGYRIGFLSLKESAFGTETAYHSSGWGLTGEAAAQTAFSNDFFGYIGATLNADFTGAFVDGNDRPLRNPSTQDEISFRQFSAGIRFGVIQYF